MRSLKLNGFLAALCALLCAAARPQAGTDMKLDDRLWEHRNLGKAFYENPDTHVQAVTELRDALQLQPDSARDRVNYGLALLRAGQTDAGVAELIRAQKQDPSIPHTWFNLGIAYKHAGDYDQAIQQFQGMIRLVPTDAIAHYNLAAVLRAQGNLEAALPEFLAAEKLNPDLAGPHFQLFSTYQRLGKREDAARERQAFEEIKKRQEGAPIPEDMEASFYSELYDPPEIRHFAAVVLTAYEDKTVSTGWDATANLSLIDAKGTGHTDLLVWSKDKIALLEQGVTLSKTSGLDNVKGALSVAVGDYDNDGLADLCVLTATGATLYHNNKGAFAKALDIPAAAGATQALWLDYDHDYDLDLLFFGPKSLLMRHNSNGTFEDKTSAFPFINGQALDAVTTATRSETPARDVVVSYADRPAVLYRDQLNEAFTATDLPAGNTAPDPRIRADFNGDKREDYATITGGAVHFFQNASPNEHWLTVRIIGVKNLKTGVNAIVEMKSGVLYQKRLYNGTPLAFALYGRAEADAIRITWPNGLIQNETHQKAEALTITEAQRLSGSCPMIFTWNGHDYQFITDVLGVAPLGASSGDGNYFPVDHDEYIQIPGAALQVKNGKYSIHITEELHEVSYLDQVQLIAVDHPSPLDIYTNDKFKSPPYPEFRLFGASRKIHPIKSTGVRGFAHNTSGVAELHTLDLDFGNSAPGNHAALVLHGWVDWADGSTFLGASQGSAGLQFPYLQVKDAQGNWQTVVQDMGIPSGKPKTIVVDLAGKFLSSSREVRIVTNLCVYWDEIFLIDNAAAPTTHLTPLNAIAADVHFRGFSEPVIDRTRQQPEKFLYNHVRPVSNWNPTPGLYTRYGDVKTLVQNPDDRMVVMGSGDELALDFPANLPPLPTGWSRDFLLLVDGWAKDADANTAFSQTVLPLPYHAMSAYPYKPTEHFPNDPEHEDYVKDFLTRPALRLLRPLTSAVARAVPPASSNPSLRAGSVSAPN